MMQLGMATMQVAQAGDEAADRGGPRRSSSDARRSLYRILAERRRRGARGGLTGGPVRRALSAEGAPL